MGVTAIVCSGTWGHDLVVARCLQAKPKEARAAEQITAAVL